jgi:hypothetical protein
LVQGSGGTRYFQGVLGTTRVYGKQITSAAWVTLETACALAHVPHDVVTKCQTIIRTRLFTEGDLVSRPSGVVVVSHCRKTRLGLLPVGINTEESRHRSDNWRGERVWTERSQFGVRMATRFVRHPHSLMSAVSPSTYARCGAEPYRQDTPWGSESPGTRRTATTRRIMCTLIQMITGEQVI